MPLNIELKPHEKIFINGAVIANGPDRAHISLLNDANILRERDILTEEKADTPCKNVYLLVQLMYMDPQSIGRYQMLYEGLSKDLTLHLPRASECLAAIDAELSAQRIYQALKIARKLIQIERESLQHDHQST
jgi:flagellar protein FlbT